MNPQQCGGVRGRGHRTVDPDQDVRVAGVTGDQSVVGADRRWRRLPSSSAGGQLRPLAAGEGDVGEVEQRDGIEGRPDLWVDPFLEPVVRRLGHLDRPRRGPGVNVVGMRWKPALTPWCGYASTAARSMQ